MSATRSPETARGDSRARWAGLAFTALAVAMVVSSATITNVAVPQIIGVKLSSTGASRTEQPFED
ncbi:hypothetical protein [Streptosporangium canum]|uniref:hypothetical protein n=1 Tax=Streptosporangium canum TaxID=324952 RepID=UPI001160256D|nr:hypothetical protein [Streptosporangium canum]